MVEEYNAEPRPLSDVPMNSLSNCGILALAENLAVAQITGRFDKKELVAFFHAIVLREVP